MRWLLPMLMLVLAGCAGVPEDTNEAPDGPDAGAGAGGDGAGGDADGAGDGAGPGGDADVPGDSDPAPGFAPQEGLEEDQEGNVSLVGVLEPCDAGFCVNATATNEGGDDVHVQSVCREPWRERMEQEGHAVQHREPVFYCEAFGTEPLGTNEMREMAFTWNGTVWDDASGTYVAGAGAYQWTIAFVFFPEAEGGAPQEAKITFTVVVGET